MTLSGRLTPRPYGGTVQLLLVRHALPLRSEPGQGSDPDLSDEGIAQAERLPAALSRFPVSRLVSSPQRRAIQTAGPLAAELGLQVEVDERLAEYDRDMSHYVPIEEIAVIQKRLIARANLVGKPVITATQMLESMVANRLPTRAEATDVANAILDGTDCVMLSGESAMGKYPEEAVAMLAKIAAATEPHRSRAGLAALRAVITERPTASAAEKIASVVEHALDTVSCAAILVPTRSGATARMISRFKPAPWIVSPSENPATCQGLVFSYGVRPVEVDPEPDDWRDFARRWLRDEQIAGEIVMLVAGPSQRSPDASHRIEFLLVGDRAVAALQR